VNEHVREFGQTCIGQTFDSGFAFFECSQLFLALIDVYESWFGPLTSDEYIILAAASLQVVPNKFFWK
jgi:hypothetical protein